MTEHIENLSIIIVTWFGDQLLFNCLESLHHVYGTAPEIIVVDNANEISTRQISRKFSNVKYIPTKRNLGFAGGNNLGLTHCTRKYILLLNNDTVVHEDSFSKLVQYLKINAKVGIVQGTLSLPLQNNTLDSCGFLLTGAGGVLGRFLNRPPHDNATETAAIYAAKGACLLFKREILNAIPGPMFHSHFFNNGEETDFCYRTWMSGYEVHYVATPPIDHLYSQTVKKLNATDNAIQSLANVLFSYLTTLSWRGLITILPGFFCYQGILFSKYVLCCQWRNASILMSAILRIYLNRKSVTLWRRRIQRSRKVPDHEILSKILVRPSFKYYYLEMRGQLNEYISTNWKSLPAIF